MTAAGTLSVIRDARAATAAARARLARAALDHCRLCSRLCGANRNAGGRGPCGAGPDARYFSAQVEMGDELELLPCFAVALSGCDLRCRFCNTRASSWRGSAGAPFVPARVAGQAAEALAGGARAIMVLGGEPTIHLPAALELVAALPGSATLVWKTNAHGSREARDLLAGLFDVWVADYKFGNDTCARRLAGVSHYTEVVRENLAWAAGQTSLIVRHLLMPGHVDCCWRPIAAWLASALPGVKVSLREEFWPILGGPGPSELRRPLGEAEARAGFAVARHFQLNLIPSPGAGAAWSASRASPVRAPLDSAR